MDEIGEGGNIENEVLVVLDNELTVNVVDIEGSIDVWVNVFVRDVLDYRPEAFNQIRLIGGY